MPPTPPTPQQSANFEYLVVTSLVLVSWELLVHFFRDLAYLRMKGWYRRPVIWAYFIQRYGAFVVAVAQANIRLGMPTSCYSAGLVSLIVGGVFVLPSISLIYLYRVLAIWNNKPAVKYAVITLWIVSFGASLTAPFSQSAANLPSGKCTITRSEAYTPASFIANAVFDSVIFVLTLIKLGTHYHQYRKFRSPVQTILLRDGVLYFAVTVAVGITDIVFLEAIKSPQLASTVIPLHVALTSVMTTRLVNNVFKVVTRGSETTIHFSPTKKTGKKATDVVPPNMSSLPMVAIGSGVGTDFFDDSTIEQSVTDMESESIIVIGFGKGTTGSRDHDTSISV